jgi:plastocyanin
MRKLFTAAVALFALALPASGLGATAAVKITATAFSPKNLTVQYGDTVTWSNADKVDHQLVADSGAFASAMLKPNATYSFTFKNAGRYPYHDALHPAIKGTITVNGPPPSVTLGAGAPIVVYGTETTLTGTVSNGQANQPVLITSRPYNGITIQQVATVMTGTGGGFAYTIKPDILTVYTAQWRTASSGQVTVQVRPKLTFLPYGGRFYAKVLVPVSYAGHSIYLQRLSAYGQWVTVEALKLGPNSGRIFSLPAFHGTSTFHVYLSANEAGAGYLDGWSGTQRVHRA